MKNEIKIAVIGLGYVGLPLARLFATKYPVIGFDINGERIKELKKGYDTTMEVEDEVLQEVLVQSIYELQKQPAPEMAEFNPSVRVAREERIENRVAREERIENRVAREERIENRVAREERIENGVAREEHIETQVAMQEHIENRIARERFSIHPETESEGSDSFQATRSDAKGLYITRDLGDITDCNHYIITVPTPVDKNNRPDLTPLLKASKSVGKMLSKGDIVIYESTVFPGATEEECVPVLEEVSGLKFNEDFFVGYSPERINPGDKEHTVEKIKKVTSGSTPEIGKKVDTLYKEVITAGTHLAPSIKVAEAAKVIENSQRDINIAFVNELAKIFNLMGIDTNDVLEAAGTKWNFLPFKPGLVGGHCIGVDPYYLAQKAQELGYHPEIILAGRRMNDSMGKYVASEVIKLMLQNDLKVKGANILVLGITFKENCPDVRNTKVVDVVRELQSYETNVTIYDPLASPVEVRREYGLESTNCLPQQKFDAIVLTVAHQEFMNLDFETLQNEKAVVYDVKGIREQRNGKF